MCEPAFRVARQVGPPCQHLRRRGPARPFLFRRYAVGSAPAEAVAGDAAAVTQRLAAGEHEIEPPLGGVDDNGARRVIAGIADRGARDRARPAAALEEIGTAAQDDA